MLRQERTEDESEALRLALLGWQSEMWTALPGILQSFDAETMTAVVAPAMRGKWRNKDGSFQDVAIPSCLDVPVQFPGGGGYTLTFPMAAGDEGLLVFSSRCIDSWWQNGGLQNNLAELRMHDLSDGFFIPGFRSKPRVLSNISANSTQLRADDGSAYVDVAAAQITLKHPTKVVVDTPELHCTGKITADGEISSGTHTLTQHKHGGVAVGGGQTATPTG